MPDFDPFDPSSWKEPKYIPTEEDRAATDVIISNIVERYKERERFRNLRNYLAQYDDFSRTEFEDDLRKDAKLQEIVTWLTSSDGLREEAIEAISRYLNRVECPHCHTQFAENDIIRDLPFDWESLGK